jgi:hypothetical protein
MLLLLGLCAGVSQAQDQSLEEIVVTGARVARGIDSPIRWVRAGMLEVALFVPYGYDVLPASVTSYTTINGGD